MGRHKTAEELSWLRSHFADTGNRDLLDAFEQVFGWRITMGSLSSWASEEGLRKTDRWTPEAYETLAEVTPGHSHKEIAAIMTERMGMDYTVEQIKGGINRKHLHTGRTGHFVKGQPPHNKGRTWDEYMSPDGQASARKTCFRGGFLSPCAIKPVGSETVFSDGYTYVKVAMYKLNRCSAHDNWRLKHHVVWEQATAKPVPKGCMLAFADGDKTNFDPDNLVLMTREEHAIINHEHISYHDRATCEAAIVLARLKAGINRAELRPRVCKACGATYTPEFANQTRCRECIDRKRR